MILDKGVYGTLKNKILLITGGTGSFGSTVVSRFLRSGVREIRIFSRDEKKQEDMRIALEDDKANFTSAIYAITTASIKPCMVSIMCFMQPR